MSQTTIEAAPNGDIPGDGRGGTGGWGGTGGHGGGPGGQPGEPGGPGAAGQVRSIGIPLASLISIILATIGGIYWLIKLESRVELVASHLATFETAVNSLNTPLSQRVFSLEARVAEVARIQTEVRVNLANMDVNDTQPGRLARREIELLRGDVSGLGLRGLDVARRVDAIQADSLENKIRIQNIIEAISPHGATRKRRHE